MFLEARYIQKLFEEILQGEYSDIRVMRIEKLYNMILHKFYPSPNIIRIINLENYAEQGLKSELKRVDLTNLMGIHTALIPLDSFRW